MHVSNCHSEMHFHGRKSSSMKTNVKLISEYGKVNEAVVRRYNRDIINFPTDLGFIGFRKGLRLA